MSASIQSTAPSSYSAPTTRCRARRRRTGARSAPSAACIASTLACCASRHAVTHVAAATDHIIESFRNRLFAGYKTGDGIPPDLWAQFPLVEEAFAALGIVVWPMVEFEADDALATAAARFAAVVDQVVIVVARQGSRAVRRWRTRRAARPHSARHLRRGGRARQVRRAAGRASPTTSRWSATAPTAFPAFPAGDASRRRPCSPRTAASRPSRTIRVLVDTALRNRDRLAAALAAQRADAQLYKHARNAAPRCTAAPSGFEDLPGAEYRARHYEAFCATARIARPGVAPQRSGDVPTNAAVASGRRLTATLT